MRGFLTFFLGFVFVTKPAAGQAVLVMPFFNLTGSADLDWISESLSQAVLDALASRGILVAGRNDRLEAYRRLSIRENARLTRASILKVAEALDAAQVVFGEFELLALERPAGAPPESQSRGRLRVRASVIDARQLRKGPEFFEQGPLEELARIQNQIAWQVLRFFAPGATPSASQFLIESAPVRLDALENYIRGLIAGTAAQKHRYFTQAARLDPGFSQPCFELGRLYWEKKEYRLAAQWLARVKPSDRHYWEANFLLGLCRYHISDFDGARAAFELVAQSVPLNEVFNNLGAAQSRRNLPEALENFEKALEGDPADADYHFNVGYALWKRREFSAAAEHFRAALERNPEDSQATVMLGRCLQKSGPRQGDPRSDGLERLKFNFEERAYRELKAHLEKNGTR